MSVFWRTQSCFLNMLLNFHLGDRLQYKVPTKMITCIIWIMKADNNAVPIFNFKVDPPCTDNQQPRWYLHHLLMDTIWLSPSFMKMFSPMRLMNDVTNGLFTILDSSQGTAIQQWLKLIQRNITARILKRQISF